MDMDENDIEWETNADGSKRKRSGKGAAKKGLAAAAAAASSSLVPVGAAVAPAAAAAAAAIPEEHESLFKSWFAAQLPALKQTLSADLSVAVASAVDVSMSKMQGQVVTILEQYDVGIQQQFNTQHGQIRELSARLDALAKASRENAESLTRVDAALSVVETATPARLFSDDAFDRPVDPCICRINGATEISAENAMAAIREVLAEMQLDRNQVALEGPPLAKAFTLRFLGGTGLASQRANKFRQLQRVGNGWRELTAVGPAGEGVKLYVDLDKNGRQRKLEATTKRLMASLKAVHPELPCFAKRREGSVATSWLPLARIILPNADEYRVEWNQHLVRDEKVDTKKVIEHLAASDREKPDVLWG